MARLPLDSRDFQPRHILIRAPNPLGDAVMAEPAMRAIAQRFPAATIDLQINASVAPIAQAWPFVRNTLPLKIRRAFVGIADRVKLSRALGKHNYDLCVLFPNSLDSALLPFMAGIGRIVGYARHGRSALLSDRIPHTTNRLQEHMIEYYWRIAETLGCGPLPVKVLLEAEPTHTARILGASDHTAPRLVATEAMRESALALLRGNLPPETCEPFIAVAPGAAYGPAKQWPTELFAQFCREATMRLNLPIVLIGTRAEGRLCDEIRAECGILTQPVVNFAGATDLATMIGLLSRAKGFVGNDSGASHLAAALGVPGVAVFGSTSDVHSGQVGPWMRIVHLHLECSPCFKRTCPLTHLNCLRDISPSQVLEQLEDTMAKRTALQQAGVGSGPSARSPRDNDPPGASGHGASSRTFLA